MMLTTNIATTEMGKFRNVVAGLELTIIGNDIVKYSNYCSNFRK